MKHPVPVEPAKSVYTQHSVECSSFWRAQIRYNKQLWCNASALPKPWHCNILLLQYCHIAFSTWPNPSPFLTACHIWRNRVKPLFIRLITKSTLYILCMCFWLNTPENCLNSWKHPYLTGINFLTVESKQKVPNKILLTYFLIFFINGRGFLNWKEEYKSHLRHMMILKTSCTGPGVGLDDADGFFPT